MARSDKLKPCYLSSHALQGYVLVLSASASMQSKNCLSIYGGWVHMLPSNHMGMQVAAATAEGPRTPEKGAGKLTEATSTSKQVAICVLCCGVGNLLCEVFFAVRCMSAQTCGPWGWKGRSHQSPLQQT